MRTATNNSITRQEETYFVLREKATGHYLCERNFEHRRLGDSQCLIVEIKDLFEPEHKLHRVWDGARDAKLLYMDRSPANFETAARETIDQLNKSVTLIDAEEKPLMYSDFELVEIDATIAVVGNPIPVL
jgi:hypothetical protein